MTLVDLHVHTSFSDGYDTPSDVVKQAAENGVGVLGIADHDNLQGLPEALAAGEKNGVKVVRGVEISSSFHGRTMHVLGYGVPLDDAAFNKFLGAAYAYRRDAMIAKMKKISADFAAAGKPPVDIEDFIRTQGRYFNREKAAQYLKMKGYFTDAEDAFELLARTRAGIGFPAQAAEAIAAIRKAGGLAILSHPFARGTSLKSIDPSPEGQEALLKELVDAGIDGLEGYQSEYGPEETAFALKLGEKYGLLVSAGSDWHGAVCDTEWDIKGVKTCYPEHIGGLNVTADKIAPLLERLGIAVDRT